MTNAAFETKQWKTEEEWLRDRRDGVGASESAALVMPDYRWASPFSLYAEKVATTRIVRRETMPQRLGKAFEGAILDEFARSERKKIGPVRWAILRSRVRPWMFCSPDAVGFEDGESFGVDAKFVGEQKAEEWEGGAAPSPYVVQCQHSMAVTGWKRWFLAVAIGNKDFKVVEVPRHDAFIDRVLTPAVDRFWNENVVKRVEPDVTSGGDATRDALAALYPEAEEAEVVLPEIATNYHTSLVYERGEAEYHLGRAELCRYMLKQMIGKAAVGWLPDGSGGYTHKNEAKKEYVVPASNGRVLRFVKPKTGGAQ